ncbi:MAG: aquaporin [Phycisphaerales bacterium]|nr:aquaporin [Phycisphaerales bacterium]
MSDRSPSLAVKSLIEFLGTFFLVCVIGLVIGRETGSELVDAIAIAGVLTALIYAGGPISGGHYNPVVTLAVIGLRRMVPSDGVAYLLAQFSGALVAAGMVAFALPTGAEIPAGETATAAESMRLAIMEFFFTFLLVFTILNVSMRKSVAGNGYFGLAIGLVVLVGMIAVGPISGAVFNPAVALGLMCMELTPWTALLWYLGSQCAGAMVAAAVFGMTTPDA